MCVYIYQTLPWKIMQTLLFVVASEMIIARVPITFWEKQRLHGRQGRIELCLGPLYSYWLLRQNSIIGLCKSYHRERERERALSENRTCQICEDDLLVESYVISLWFDYCLKKNSKTTSKGTCITTFGVAGCRWWKKSNEFI